MPPKKRRGHGWKQRPARNAHAATAPPPSEPAPAPSEGVNGSIDDMPADCVDVEPSKWLKLLDFAHSLWLADYRPLLQAEDAAAQQALEALPQSSYRHRLRGDAAAAYDGGWGGSWSPVSRGISRSNSNCSAGSACSGGSGGW